MKANNTPEVIESIELSKLHPFPDHPFAVRDDDTMQQTVESIKQYGVLVPAIARPREDGGYELIAGHRRKYACELAGLKTMPVIIRDVCLEFVSGGCGDPPLRTQTTEIATAIAERIN